MLARSLLTFLALIVGISSAHAQQRRLNARDVAEIKRVCRQLIGAAIYREVDPILKQLTPYLQAKSGLDHLIADCHSQHCNTSIPLCDDAEVWYLYLHAPSERSIKGGYFDITPDIEIKGNNRIETVAFVRRGKLLFSKGALPEWFADGHLHNAR